MEIILWLPETIPFWLKFIKEEKQKNYFNKINDLLIIK